MHLAGCEGGAERAGAAAPVPGGRAGQPAAARAVQKEGPVPSSVLGGVSQGACLFCQGYKSGSRVRGPVHCLDEHEQSNQHARRGTRLTLRPLAQV